MTAEQNQSLKVGGAAVAASVSAVVREVVNHCRTAMWAERAMRPTNRCEMLNCRLFIRQRFHHLSDAFKTLFLDRNLFHSYFIALKSNWVKQVYKSRIFERMQVRIILIILAAIAASVPATAASYNRFNAQLESMPEQNRPAVFGRLMMGSGEACGVVDRTFFSGEAQRARLFGHSML